MVKKRKNMDNNSVDKIDRISHHISSLSEDMHEIKKTIIEKEEKNRKIATKLEKRRKSLKKAQSRFKNVSTNLKVEEYEKFEKRLKELNLSKSAYLKKLILDDLEKAVKEKKEV